MERIVVGPGREVKGRNNEEGKGEMMGRE